MRVGIGKAIAACVGAAGVGGALMFFLDPDRGNRRRALVRDKTMSAVTCTGRSIGKTARDIGNRAQGVVASTRSLVTRENSADGDDVLVERVRSKIGHAISDPQSIEVFAKDGNITLRGRVARSEMGHLMSAVYSIRGVSDVRNEIRVGS